MKRIRVGIFGLLAAAAILPLACATTTFQSTWRSPTARPLRLAGRKVAAVFVHNDPALQTLQPLPQL